MQYYPENPEKRAQDAAIAGKGTYEESSDANYYAPPAGVTTIRIMPPYNAEGDWYFETYQHYVPHMRGYFTCPGVFDDYCPICSRGQELYAEGGEDNVKAAKDLQPNKYYLYNAAILSGKPIRDGGDSPNIGETKSLTVLRVGTMVHRALLELHTDEQLQCTNIFDLANGVNLNIKRTGTTRNNTEYTVHAAGRSNFAQDLEGKGIDINSLQLIDLQTAFPVRDEEFLEKCSDVSKAGNFPGAKSGPASKGVPVSSGPSIPAPAAPAPKLAPQPVAPTPQPAAPAPQVPQPTVSQPATPDVALGGPQAPQVPQAPEIPAPPVSNQ